MGCARRRFCWGLVVTFIWATSWILTPMIIQEFDPIHYAGVRFFDRWIGFGGGTFVL